MSQHNINTEMQQGPFPTTYQGEYTTSGYMRGWGTALPTLENWAPGAIYQVVSASAAALYKNDGTATTASWTAVSLEGGQEDFGTGGLKSDVISESTSGSGVTADGVLLKDGGATIASAATLAVTTADKLTVGGIIVPQSMIVPFLIMPHATLLTRHLFYAQTDGWTVTGAVAIPDLVEGGALTGVISKCTGNNLPVAATTPIHTGTIDCNATAGTPQVLTLTGTGADLVLAATNKLGIVFSGALTTGVLAGFIKLKRS